MKIKMAKTTPGAVAGIYIRKFESGMVYSIPDQIDQRLADLFLKMGVAKVARERSIYETPITPMVEAPERAVVAPPEIKVKPEIAKAEKPKIESVKIEPEPTKEKVVMRVYQLADELKLTSKDVIKLANDLGIHAPAPQSGLSEREVQEIKNGLS
jgi:hypothetical protein